MQNITCQLCGAPRRHLGPCRTCSGLVITNRHPNTGPALSIKRCDRCGGHQLTPEGACPICDAGRPPLTTAPPPLPPRSLARKVAASVVKISRALFGKFSPEQRKNYIANGGTITN